MTTYKVEVITSRNTVFRWEIEDTTTVNVLTRLAKNVRALDVVSIKIVGA